MGEDQESVLVVEDEKELADIFDIWLSEEFGVEIVTDGSTALEMLDRPYDVVILDWRLPDVPGRELLEYINQQEVESAVAIITGDDPDTIAIEDGVDTVLHKPVRSKELTETVKRLAKQ